MLDAPDRAARRTVLARQYEELGVRIAEAQASRRMIEHAMACEAEDFMQCPTFRQLVAAVAEGNRTPLGVAATPKYAKAPHPEGAGLYQAASIR